MARFSNQNNLVNMFGSGEYLIFTKADRKNGMSRVTQSTGHEMQHKVARNENVYSSFLPHTIFAIMHPSLFRSTVRTYTKLRGHIFQRQWN